MENIKLFKIGSIQWTIEENDNLLDELKLMGLCEFPKSKITIYKNGIDKNLIEQTIYHEVVHAILESMGEYELSSKDNFVQSFSLLLHQFEKTKK